MVVEGREKLQTKAHKTVSKIIGENLPNLEKDSYPGTGDF
jgi:hypothetical protein